MNLKDRIIFLILSFGITTLVLSYTGNYPFQFTTSFNLAFAVANEAEVNTEKEQENKCKKDTECENENELNNSLNIVNETGAGAGQLTVIKTVICENPVGGGSVNTASMEQPHLTTIQFVPSGVPAPPCRQIEQDIEPEDFIFTVTGNNPNPSNFPGSSSGVIVTLGAGPYDVEETSNIPQTAGPFEVKIQTTETGDCSGTILSGESKTCTFTNDITFELPQGP